MCPRERFAGLSDSSFRERETESRCTCLISLAHRNHCQQRDVARWERETNHWYMKANYTDLALQLMYRRHSRGADELTGEWRPATEQQAVVA